MEEIKKETEKMPLISPQEIKVEEPQTNPIEEAKKILEETKTQLQLIKEERIRIEKAKAEELIQGKGNAGQKPIVPIETSKEYAEKVLKGVIKAK